MYKKKQTLVPFISLLKQAFIIIFLCTLFTVAAQPSNESALAEQYFLDKEYDSALELYEKLYKKEPTELLVNRIVYCYESLGKFDEAILFMDKAIKRQPEQVLYPAIKASIFEKTGNTADAEAIYKDLITKKLRTEAEHIQVGAYLYKIGKLETAEMLYLEGRKKLKNQGVFCEELARIYEVQGMADKAVYEFIQQYYHHRETYENMNLAVLNTIGVSPVQDKAIEKVLLKESDINPGDLGVRKMLFEYYVLTKDFREAFVQVKAIDKFFKETGERVFRFGETMRNNKNYELSNQAYDYIIQNKTQSEYYQRAFFEKATNGEIKAFEKIPPDLQAVREAVKAYNDLLTQFGRLTPFFNAIYRKANLQVFYLNEFSEPLNELKEAALMPGLSKEDWAKSKLLIADILLIQKDFNGAKMIYTEVSEAFKDRQTGAMAKYRLALMSYYKGEFELASALLTAIKDNTSNDISNDAIQLNLRIIDNTGLDSTTEALEMFAKAQLWVYQRNYDEAMNLMDSLLFKYPNHALTDEVLWEKANIYLKQNDIPKTIEFLDKIYATFPDDIYGDDAIYTKARLYDYNMQDPETALKLYLEFLRKYPGSLFSVEVRKRIRELRKEG